jgi:CHAD domain-containing protein
MARAKDIPGVEAGAPFQEVAGRVVETRTRELFAEAEGVLNTDDIERVHDMRVASRRLRAVLEIFAVCFPKRAHREVLRDVKRLADALGARRDPDVQIDAMRSFAAAVGEEEQPGLEYLIRSLEQEQTAGNVVLAGALDDARSSGLEERLLELAASVVPSTPEPEPEPGAAAA